MSPAALHTIAVAHRALAWCSVAMTTLAASLAFARYRSAPRGPSHAPRTRLATAASLSAILLAATAASGLALHEPYQRRLRQRIFLQSPRIGWLFERKEHLAFGAVLLAFCAFAALAAAELRDRRRNAAPDAITRDLHSAIVRAYATSALLAAAAAVASAIVSRAQTF